MPRRNILCVKGILALAGDDRPTRAVPAVHIWSEDYRVAPTVSDPVIPARRFPPIEFRQNRHSWPWLVCAHSGRRESRNARLSQFARSAAWQSATPDANRPLIAPETCPPLPAAG